MRRVVAAFVREVAKRRYSVRVGYCVSQLIIVMECSTVIVRVCGGVNEDVSIE